MPVDSGINPEVARPHHPARGSGYPNERTYRDRVHEDGRLERIWTINGANGGNGANGANGGNGTNGEDVLAAAPIWFQHRMAIEHVRFLRENGEDVVLPPDYSNELRGGLFCINRNEVQQSLDYTALFEGVCRIITDARQSGLPDERIVARAIGIFRELKEAHEQRLRSAHFGEGIPMD